MKPHNLKNNLLKKLSDKNVLCCPKCKEGALLYDTGKFICESCGKYFEDYNGLPCFISHQLLNTTIDDLNLKDKKIDSTLANAVYHNSIADSYENDASTLGMLAESDGSFRRINDALEKIKKLIPEDGVFLDIGSGTGNILSHAGSSFKHVLGIDVSYGMLRKAQERNYNVALADAENIPLMNSSCSCVSAFSVLHHFDRHENLFQEIYRILKKGGVFYTDWDPVCLPFAPRYKFIFSLALKTLEYSSKIYFSRDWVKNKSEKLKEIEKLAEAHAVYSTSFLPENLERMLYAVGFSKVSIYYHNNSPVLKTEKNTWKDKLWHMARLIAFGHFPLLGSKGKYKQYFTLIIQK